MLTNVFSDYVRRHRSTLGGALEMTVEIELEHNTLSAHIALVLPRPLSVPSIDVSNSLYLYHEQYPTSDMPSLNQFRFLRATCPNRFKINLFKA